MNEAPAKSIDLGERLMGAGMVSAAQLELADREQIRKRQPLGKVLVDLGFVVPEKLSSFLAKEANTRFVELGRLTIDYEAVSVVPLDLLRRFRALPIAKVNGLLTVALADPLNVLALDILREITGLQLEVVTATERDILNCLDHLESAGGSIQESIDRIIKQKAEEDGPVVDMEAEAVDATEADAPTIRLVSQIIARAVETGASDIHFEPEERMVRIRTRVDGVLQPDVFIPKALQSLITARMKILADLDVAEARMPQDGRATVVVGRRQINLRVSSLPTSHEESVVVRILNPSARIIHLDALGFSAEVEGKLRLALDQPHGVIVVTGPTGSGKTTTLYAVLNEISTTDLSIFTLEDPIEFRMPGIRQTQIKEEIGLTFSHGLRSLLRQDPDVILVGETRDTETAQLMVRAALTGHLVFTTLHTNDAPGALPRLTDMGVEPYLLPDSLIAVLGQRLVRKVCERCKETQAHPERVFEELKIKPPAGLPLQLWRGAGCEACKRTGFKGRQAIFEFMMIDHRFHDAIVHRAGSPEFARLAKESGMTSMFEDGVRRAVQGVTTIQELLRVTRLTGAENGD